MASVAPAWLVLLFEPTPVENQEYQFAIPKPRIRLAEKQVEEEEHRQLQSVVRFTQTPRGGTSVILKLLRFVLRMFL